LLALHPDLLGQATGSIDGIVRDTAFIPLADADVRVQTTSGRFRTRVGACHSELFLDGVRLPEAANADDLAL
jgi:hypothetical protein